MAVSLSKTVYMEAGFADWKVYLLPNDEDEADRLDMIHEMMLTVMDRKLFLAPIGDSPQHVLDLGAGTGLWALDFGKPLKNILT